MNMQIIFNVFAIAGFIIAIIAITKKRSGANSLPKDWTWDSDVVSPNITVLKLQYNGKTITGFEATNSPNVGIGGAVLTNGITFDGGSGEKGEWSDSKTLTGADVIIENRKAGGAQNAGRNHISYSIIASTGNSVTSKILLPPNIKDKSSGSILYFGAVPGAPKDPPQTGWPVFIQPPKGATAMDTGGIVYGRRDDIVHGWYGQKPVIQLTANALACAAGPSTNMC